MEPGWRMEILTQYLSISFFGNRATDDSPHVPELGSVPILDKRPSLHQAISNTTANLLNAAPVDVGQRGWVTVSTNCLNDFGFAAGIFRLRRDHAESRLCSFYF